MRLLHIIPYSDLLPPRNGGAIRCANLLRALAREFDVDLIILQKEADLLAHAATYGFPPSVRVHSAADRPPPFTVFDCLPPRFASALRYRWLARDWRGPAQRTFLQFHHLIMALLARGETIHCALFEHLSSMTLAPVIRRFSPQTRCILDAHNVDHILDRQRLGHVASDGDRDTIARLADHSRRMESQLARYVDSFWACSDADRRSLEEINTITGVTIPNGVDSEYFALDADDTKAEHDELIFCGTLNYEPNIAGLDWFYRHVWPEVVARDSKLRLTIVGRGGDPVAFSELQRDSTVHWVGEVDDVRPHYRRAGIAIAPLLMGSGTRIKILEAMSLGNPVVSTPKGAEGIDIRPGTDLLVADAPGEFAAAILSLRRDHNRFHTTRRAARELVQHRYDWRVAGRIAPDAVRAIVANHSPARGGA